MKRNYIVAIVALATLLVFVAISRAAGPPVKTAAPPAPVVLSTPEPARMIQYGARDTVELRTKVGYITLIVLPEKERIVEVLIGSNEHWEVGPEEKKSVIFNSAWVRPLKDRVETNLHLKTLSQNSYSFRLVTVPGDPDYKVFVMPKDQEMRAAIEAPPRFVEASQVESLKKDVEGWREDALRYRKEKADIERESVQMIAAAKAEAARDAHASEKHVYRFTARTPPFNIAAVYNDGKFTYIRADPEEAPALYEMRDDKPNLIQWKFSNGLYTVDKVLGTAYLQMGKKKTGIERID